ncbi:MAG TPA: type II toxin-antitoxin system RelE/ParE family toxin [Verrucomicrobia bacterium]|nr:type II toxin-antitoxin system RelE/ParE family toxin [Verrucomicrobiota bacterium]
MKIRILDVAQSELEVAVSYYNQECPGLGYEFADEIFRTIRRATENPTAWPSLSRRTRRCLAHRFPYGIVYQIRGEELLVVSVMHLHRHPDSWR